MFLIDSLTQLIQLILPSAVGMACHAPLFFGSLFMLLSITCPFLGSLIQIQLQQPF